MKKILKSTLAVAVLAFSAIIGYVSYNEYQNQQLAFANPLIEENIEALADDGNVPNGYILKEDPMFYKTCYHQTITRIEDKVEVCNGRRIAYPQYKHKYTQYKRYDCNSYKVSEHQYFGWWKDCTKKGNGICNSGDIDFRPKEMEYTSVDYNNGHEIGNV